MTLWSNDGTVKARPTWANTDNSRTYGNTYPVLPLQVDATNTKTQSIHAGWVSGRGYKDAQVDARYKFETLVAMSSMANTVIYSTSPLTGYINVATASNTVNAAIVRTNTLQAGKIAVTTNRSRIVGTGTAFNTNLVPGSVIRYASTQFGTVNNVSNSTVLYLTSNTVTAHANSLFYKVVDTKATKFDTELTVGSQIMISNNLVRTVKTIANSTQLVLTAAAGSTGANSEYETWVNTTGPKFFHV
jgi:hypothetical protein